MVAEENFKDILQKGHGPQASEQWVVDGFFLPAVSKFIPKRV